MLKMSGSITLQGALMVFVLLDLTRCFIFGCTSLYMIYQLVKQRIKSSSIPLSEIPVKYRTRVQKVLSISNGRLRWSDKGELISSSGHLVKGSNICELLINMVSPQKSKDSVKGLNDFTKVLDSLYMPIVLRDDHKISSKTRTVKKNKKDSTVVHALSNGKAKDKSSSIPSMRSKGKNVSNKLSKSSQGINWAIF